MSLEDELRAELRQLGVEISTYTQYQQVATEARRQAESRLPELMEEERRTALALRQAQQAREQIQRDYDAYRREHSE
jgi:hypothetical protein